MINVVYDQNYSHMNLRVMFAYNPEIIAAVKTIPGARWNPGGKCWEVPTSSAYLVKTILGAWEIRWHGLSEPTEAPPRPHFESAYGNPFDSMYHRLIGGYLPPNYGIIEPIPVPKTSWAQHLFAAMGPDRAVTVFRALSKILHPDAPTGDAMLMRQLLDARDDERNQ